MVAYTVTELDSADLTSDDLKKMLDIWTQWCGDRTMPRWKQVDLLEVPRPLLGQTSVVDVRHQPLDFTYRYWGSGFRRVHDKEMTGLSVDDLTPADVSRCSRESFTSVTEQKSPLLFRQVYEHENESLVTDLALRLPISEDGSNVDKILSVIESTGMTETNPEILLG